ncbi:hypothetical protein A2954_01990 [Candidatus Roizmanbacteria bacterium RIFCSPLOWO2_01_FULL_37_12]|uniref:GIY-YIG domain-containing protein n=1 Tax=Candidatus Roizmanbacteria bacterium RIFCSPLOWO2_01_FULL_37_12 TaxID=1802056 RepID=A0A1F7I9L9_9BACT|nr:MAG: hypothetical protein A2768_01475 [Candidatus Roizmanbacteria bacterium RIFCSPHIGHO2_01_FULL_37_16]OGK23291.1 MAG: hypothetical protein A3D76_00710 [Candidatus Roizmanbacteria bacterium RIFCSPHIGHO2_02_FULL_37_9b]OGK40063.1 MAG: hypothetical protein A2954_01990 [Candidatus Roizmanbacteria bacterium RIFCSPLOWO2_01_FULL_37_12]
MFYTYILLLSNGENYVGHTDDLKQRYKYHQDGRVIATKDFRPITLVFYSAFSSEIKAIKFEKYLKSSSGHAFRNKRLI